MLLYYAAIHADDISQGKWVFNPAGGAREKVKESTSQSAALSTDPHECQLHIYQVSEILSKASNSSLNTKDNDISHSQSQ